MLTYPQNLNVFFKIFEAFTVIKFVIQEKKAKMFKCQHMPLLVSPTVHLKYIHLRLGTLKWQFIYCRGHK